MVDPNTPVYPNIQNPSTTTFAPTKSITPVTQQVSEFDKAFASAQSLPIPTSKYTTPAIESPLEPTLRYDDPIYGYSALNPNLEAQYANRQNWLSSFVNNIGKFGANTLSTIGSTFAAIPYGIKAIVDGKASEIYNNPIVNGLNSWTEGLENSLSSYQGQYEQDHPILSAINPFKWGAFTNTWGSVLKNVGFVAGDLASSLLIDAGVGAVTGGAGDIPLVAAQGEKIASDIGRFAKVISSTDETVNSFNQALDAGENVKDAVNKLAGSARLTNGVKYGLKLFTSTIGQSALIANNTYRSSQQELTADYVNKYGVAPTGQEAENIDKLAVGAANTNLVANMAMMSLSHAYSLKSFFSPTAQALREGIQQDIATGTKLAVNPENIDEIQNTANKAKGISRFLPSGRSIKNIGVQALQGGGMYFTDNVVKDYIKRKFDDKNIDDFDNVWKSLGEGFANTFLTKEGEQSVLLGALTGALINGGSKLYEKIRGAGADKNTVISNVLNNLNSETITGLFENNYNEGVNAASIARDMQDAAKNNDPFKYKNLQLQSLYNFVSSATKSGRFDLRIDQLNALKDLNQQQFETLFNLNYTDENRRVVGDYVDTVIKKAFDIKETVGKVNDAFPNPYSFKKERDNFNTFENYKDALSLTLAHLDDNRNRIRDLNSDLQSIFPTIESSKLINLTNEEGIKQTIQDFENRVKELNTSKSLLEGTGAEDLKDQHDKEISFLEHKIDFLKKNNDVSRNLKEEGEIVNYYKDNNLTGEKVNHLDLVNAIAKAQDIYKLGYFSDGAVDYYNTLATKDGYDKFSDFVNQLRESNDSKIEVGPNGKFTRITPELLAQREQQRQQELAQQHEEALNAKNEPEATTDEEKQKLNDIVEKEKNKQPLTPEEETLKQQKKTAYENKKKAAAKATQKEYEDLTFEDQIAIDEKKDLDAKKADIENRRQQELASLGSPKILPNDLKGAKPTYNYGNKHYNLTFDNDIDRAAYILAQTNKSKRDSDYLNFVMNSTGMSEGEAREYGKKIKNYIKEQAKAGNGGDINIPNQYKEEIQTPEKINAKYDKELENLTKSKQSTEVKPTVAKPVSQKQYKGATPNQLLNSVLSLDFADGVKRATNLYNRLFKQASPEKLHNEISLSVSPSEKGKKPGEFTKIPIPNTDLYRNGYDIDIVIKAGNQEIGQLQDNLYFEREGKKLPITELTKEEYSKVTGNDENTYDSFMKEMNGYQDIINQIRDKYAKGETEISNKDLKNIIGNLSIFYGAADYVTTPQDSTLLKNAKYQPKDSYVLSYPYVRDPVTQEWNRVEKPNIIGENGIVTDLPKDLEDFLRDNIDQITGLDRRYIALFRMPNGELTKASPIAARPAIRPAENLDVLLKAMKSGNKTEIQKELDNIYIADANNRRTFGNKIQLKQTDKGDFTLDIQNDRKKKLRATKIPISKDELAKVNNFDQFVDLLNRKISAEKGLKSLNIDLAKPDFKSNVLKDENTNFNDLKDKLTITTNPAVFKDFSLSIKPKEEIKENINDLSETRFKNIHINNLNQELEDKQTLLTEGKSLEDIEKLSPVELKQEVEKVKPNISNNPLNKNNIGSALARAFRKIYGTGLDKDQISKFQSKLVEFEPDGKLKASYVQSILAHKDLNISVDGAKKISNEIGVVKGNPEYHRLRESPRQEKPINQLKNNFDVLNEINFLQEKIDNSEDKVKIQDYYKKIDELEKRLNKDSEDYKRAKTIFDNFDSITKELEKDGSLKIDCT